MWYVGTSVTVPVSYALIENRIAKIRIYLFRFSCVLENLHVKKANLLKLILRIHSRCRLRRANLSVTQWGWGWIARERRRYGREERVTSRVEKWIEGHRRVWSLHWLSSPGDTRKNSHFCESFLKSSPRSVLCLSSLNHARVCNNGQISHRGFSVQVDSFEDTGNCNWFYFLCSVQAKSVFRRKPDM